MSPRSATPTPSTVTAAGPAVVAGTDLLGALTAIRGELGDPHLPNLPLLPDRGPGADAAGRAAALLVDLPVEVGPHGWRVTARPGEDLRRSRSLLASDVNVLADLVGVEQTSARRIGVAVLGPFSLATMLDLAGGERLLADHGARRDLADSLAAGLAAQLQGLRVALPDAAVTLRVDEPALDGVLAGTVPTASGYRTLRAVDRGEVRQVLRRVVEVVRDAGATAVVLAVEVGALPLSVARDVEADGLAVPATALAVTTPSTVPDALGDYLDGGGAIVVELDTAAAGGNIRQVNDLAGQVLDPWRRLGLPAARLPQVTVTSRTPRTALTGTTASTTAPDAGRLPTLLRRLVAAADALDTTARDG
ncbi:hypothetical protein BKD30_03860 [Tersicoccus phoenicis]|uniref:Methionine synthase n=1 Tax=Tersicoccus phoenicis TaxID=554083 RepID=A0A1R1LHP2_9MICC|nr:hypothetical protein [Tersicoccus phoenicis]OMH27036.1 hypothetical protein BKD30_03860 [Tersicoccus phoenicis]